MSEKQAWKKEEDRKKRKESRYVRIIQIIKEKIIVVLWSFFHESETCEKKIQLNWVSKNLSEHFFFSKYEKWKSNQEMDTYISVQFWENIKHPCHQISYYNIFQNSLLYKTVLALWAEPRTLKFSDEWWLAFFFPFFSLYFYKLGNVNGWKGVFMIYDLTLEQFALLEKQ